MSHHRTRRRAVRAALVVAALSLLAAPAAAIAEPLPTGEWPTCGAPGETDGKWCVQDVRLNGAPVPPLGPDGAGKALRVYKLMGDSHAFGYQALRYTGMASPSETPDLDAGDVWTFTVNTGTWIPRGTYATGGPVTFSATRDAVAGNRVTVSITVAPVSFFEPFSACTTNDCGDDTRASNLEYAGWANGIVDDFGGWTEAYPGMREDMTGYAQSTTAQMATDPQYDFDTGALVVRFGNAHLKADGVTPVTGTYEAFVPTTMLTSIMGVPDPAALTGGMMSVVRQVDGTVRSAPFTVTHEAGGIRLRITGITYSNPTYRIRVKRTRPGMPDVTRAQRVDSTHGFVRWTRPAWLGGSKLRGFLVRCTAPRGRDVVRVRVGAAARSATISQLLPSRSYRCSVRARNATGWGRASSALPLT